MKCLLKLAIVALALTLNVATAATITGCLRTDGTPCEKAAGTPTTYLLDEALNETTTELGIDIMFDTPLKPLAGNPTGAGGYYMIDPDGRTVSDLLTFGTNSANNGSDLFFISDPNSKLITGLNLPTLCTEDAVQGCKASFLLNFNDGETWVVTPISDGDPATISISDSISLGPAPEPGSAALFGGGLIAMFFLIRKLPYVRRLDAGEDDHRC